MSQAVLHVNFATNISLHKDRVLRAYSIWACLRPTGQDIFEYEDILNWVMEKSGRTRRTVKSWLEAGIDAGFFKRDGWRLILVGRLKMFGRFLSDDELPGIAVLVDADMVLKCGRRELHALIFGLQFVKKEHTWISRQRLRGLTRRSERTQLRYDKVNRQPKTFTSWVLNTPDGESRQMPNIYRRSSKYFTRTKKQGSKVHRNRELSSDSLKAGGSCERIRSNGFELVETKVLFDTAEKAQQAANRRSRKGLNPMTFSVVPDGQIKKTRAAKKYGHVFMKAHMPAVY